MKYQVSSKSIDIKTNDGVCDSFLSLPNGSGKFPAVLFLMDGFGLRPYLNEMAIQLASEGYFVLQPNLLYRIRRSPVLNVSFPITMENLPQVRAELIPLVKSYIPENGLQDIKIFLDFLSKQDGWNGQIGVTGYCMGGSLAIRTAARYPDKISAAASFHAGMLATEMPDSPHLLLSKIKAPIYVAHADNDGSMTAEQIEKFQKAVESSGINAQVELYKGAIHGFTMMDLPAYNPEALSRHWKELFSLFSKMQ